MGPTWESKFLIMGISGQFPSQSVSGPGKSWKECVGVDACVVSVLELEFDISLLILRMISNK